MTRILLADDHPLYLEAVHQRLQRLLPAAQLIDASTLAEALDAAHASPPGEDPLSLILLDYHMPGVEGSIGVSRIMGEFPGVPVAIMSGVATAEDVNAVIKAGAHGFIPKTMSADQFAAAITLLISGGTFVPTDVLRSLIASPEDDQPPSALTEKARGMRDALATLRPRELEVLLGLANGRSNKEIARELSLAEITIKLHVRQILKKLQLRNRSEAAALATRAGLV